MTHLRLGNAHFPANDLRDRVDVIAFSAPKIDCLSRQLFGIMVQDPVQRTAMIVDVDPIT